MSTSRRINFSLPAPSNGGQSSVGKSAPPPVGGRRRTVFPVHEEGEDEEDDEDEYQRSDPSRRTSFQASTSPPTSTRHLSSPPPPTPFSAPRTKSSFSTIPQTNPTGTAPTSSASNLNPFDRTIFPRPRGSRRISSGTGTRGKAARVGELGYPSGSDGETADPDANFFRMDSLKMEDDSDDELPVRAGGSGKRGSAAGLVTPTAPTNGGQSSPGLMSGTAGVTGLIGNKGIGTVKDVILDETTLPFASPSSPDGRERLEWQTMLASVLGGEILKGEKSRIGGERPTNETFRKEMGEGMWWQIRARLRGRGEEEERRRVRERRERLVDGVLEEVAHFRVVIPEPEVVVELEEKGSVDEEGKVEGEKLEGEKLEEKVDGEEVEEDVKNRGETDGESAITAEAAEGGEEGGQVVESDAPKGITEEEAGKELEASRAEHTANDHAMLQTLSILAKLSSIEALYPTLHALRREKPLYDSADFQLRIHAISAWSTVVRGLEYQLVVLQRWTGSDELDVTKPNTTAERALVGKAGYHPMDSKARSKLDQAADDSTFIERLLKEDSLRNAFAKRAMTDLYRLIYTARQTVIDYSDMFAQLGLATFESELVLLIAFPARLIIEALRVRLDAVNKLVDPSVMVIDDMTDNFRLTLNLALEIKAQYLQIVEPDAAGKWKIPPCLGEEYDDIVLDGLRTFFKLLHWKLKSGSKAIYFKETEVLNNEWEFLNNIAEAVEGGDIVVAEHFCSLTNKLMVRVTNYFETQLRVPISRTEATHNKTVELVASLKAANAGTEVGPAKARETKVMDTEEMVTWFSKILDAVRLRYRKLQSFARRLTQRFDNSAEYDIEDIDLDLIIESLVDTNHFLVYTQAFEEDGTYIIADATLRDRPDLIRQLLLKAFSAIPVSGERYRRRRNEDFERAEYYTEPANENVYSSGEDGGDAAEEHTYLLIFSPRRKFVWTGGFMHLEMPFIELSVQDDRIRLIADGPVHRLALCKDTFMSSFMEPGQDEPFVHLECLVEQQAHLPRLQRELRKISKSTHRLSESIVESVGLVRRALKGAPGSQDLVENWYAFASDHGHRVGIHMNHQAWSKFSRLLMRLAIGWVAFICDQCDPSDRKTFRWAVNALEYAMTMTRGNNILHLDAKEFALLRTKVASCMALLISHFDILGARSSIEAKKEAEKIEAMRRLQRLQDNLVDDPDGALVATEQQDQTPTARIYALFKEVYGGAAGDRSIKMVREERMRLLTDLEASKINVNESHLVGQVLDEEVSEDRSLVFLANSSSNIALKWQQGTFIGGGAFGSVYIGFNLDSGGIMAVKEIRVQDLSNTPALYKQIKDESDVMQMLSHPNIVDYYGIEVHRDRVYIFEEYCEGGSLANLLEHGRIEDEEVIIVYTLQMLQGLEYLHSKGVEHRDVKPDNVLLGANSTIKFVDFGAARVINKGNRTMAKTRAPMGNRTGGTDGVPAMNSLAGTPMYMAPEIIKNEALGRLGAMDVWSLGCIVLEFATGKKPWSNLDNEWAIMFHIGVATKHPPLPDPGQMSDIGIDFIDQCLTLEAQFRPTATELLKHSWLAETQQQLLDHNAYQQQDSYFAPSTQSLTSTLVDSEGYAPVPFATQLAAAAEDLHHKAEDDLSPMSMTPDGVVSPAETSEISIADPDVVLPLEELEESMQT